LKSFFNNKVAQIFWLLFSTVHIYKFWRKNGFGYILGDFFS
jgi:hypothetical protein